MGKKEENEEIFYMSEKWQKYDVGQIRTDAPEGTRFLVLRDNHSATTPIDEKISEFVYL